MLAVTPSGLIFVLHIEFTLKGKIILLTNPSSVGGCGVWVLVAVYFLKGKIVLFAWACTYSMYPWMHRNAKINYYYYTTLLASCKCHP
jgi:hypothetical protein